MLQHTVERVKLANPGLRNPIIIDINNPNGKELVRRDEFGRWLPGSIPNPQGGKLQSSLPSCLRAELEKIDEKTGKTNAQLIAEQVIQRAQKGDTKMIEMAFDYITGKPVQAIQTQMIGAVKIVVEYAQPIIIEQETPETPAQS